MSGVVPGLAFGGDYNPEQWGPQVHREDVELMRRARVTLVTLGVFSWAELEPRPGEVDLSDLSETMDRLHAAGIAVDLATPTAAPPIWLHQAHPEILPVTRTGQRYAQGGRLGWCASSPVWREHALRIVEALARGLGSHPALRLWHLSNELGGGNRRCYCDVSAEHFRRWLRARYGDVDALNAAWGTAFWGHRYTALEQVLPPRDSETIGLGNPGLVLDFDRFSSDALLEHYRAEREVVRRHSPHVPVTTNFMVGVGPHPVDYARWAREVDVVATDHYVRAADPERAADVAFAADRTRGLRPDRPWLLMETAAAAVSWQPVNRPPEPGELRRTALAHVGRGADGVLFFQWRQSVAGAEQFHSAMVTHAGAEGRVFGEVAALGAELEAVAPLAGTLVEPARVALVVDDEAGWAWESGPKPVVGWNQASEAARAHRVLWRQGIRCDVLPPDGDLTGYDVVVAPALFLLAETTAAALRAVAERGGRVLVTRLTGVVQETNTVVPGGYPGLLRDLLGVRAQEHVPLLADERVELVGSDGSPAGDAGDWAEVVATEPDVEVVRRYRSTAGALLDGGPALTRRAVGTGQAWYVSAALDDDTWRDVLGLVCDGLDVGPHSPGLDVTRRTGGTDTFVVAINHGSRPAALRATGTDLRSGRHLDHPLVAPGDALVLQEDP